MPAANFEIKPINRLLEYNTQQVQSAQQTNVGTHADEHAQWRYTKSKTNTNPKPDPNRYRRRCPDPNARVVNFHDRPPLPGLCSKHCFVIVFFPSAYHSFVQAY